MQFQSVGVFAINGPNWATDLPIICENWPGTVCNYFTSITGSQGQAVKSEQYWLMNGLTDRFQEFDDIWLEGDTETTLVDVSQIKQVPMTFFIGTKDQTCPQK